MLTLRAFVLPNSRLRCGDVATAGQGAVQHAQYQGVRGARPGFQVQVHEQLDQDAAAHLQQNWLRTRADPGYALAYQIPGIGGF